MTWWPPTGRSCSGSCGTLRGRTEIQGRPSFRRAGCLASGLSNICGPRVLTKRDRLYLPWSAAGTWCLRQSSSNGEPEITNCLIRVGDGVAEFLDILNVSKFGCYQQSASMTSLSCKCLARCHIYSRPEYNYVQVISIVHIHRSNKTKHSISSRMDCPMFGHPPTTSHQPSSYSSRSLAFSALLINELSQDKALNDQLVR